MINVGILTISDKGFAGEREDLSGKTLRSILLKEKVYSIKRYKIIPDEIKDIKEELVSWSDQDKLDLILTTGGTGFSPRDVTPEATKEIIIRETVGISDTIRNEGRKRNRRAILSRAVAGIRGNTLIINLPGSERGVRESLETIIDIIPHAVEMIEGKGH